VSEPLKARGGNLLRMREPPFRGKSRLGDGLPFIRSSDAF